MIDIDRSLRDLAAQIEVPPAPDLEREVMAAIRNQARPPRGLLWRPRVAQVAATAAAILLVVVLVPSVREQVQSWLGLGGVRIVDTGDLPGNTEGRPEIEERGAQTEDQIRGLGSGLDLGTIVSLQEAASRAGFAPLTATALGPPDEVYVDAGDRVWMLYAAGPELPPTAIDGVGAVVTEFRTAVAPGITKEVAGGVAGAQFVELEGFFGVWIEGPHRVVLELDGSSIGGRSAGNTLLWETGDLTFRLETELSLEEAMVIARSFR